MDTRQSSEITSSVSKQRRGNLARQDLDYRPPKWASEMLRDFANARQFGFFQRKWQWRDLKTWKDGEVEFIRTQNLVQEIWRGGQSGADVVAEELGLGSPLDGGDPEMTERDAKAATSRPQKRCHIYTDWSKGTLYMLPLDLNELVWITLLHESSRLAICKHWMAGDDSDGKCQTPYFLKYRPQQEFCSNECSKSRQRESKRRWWRTKGKQWLEGRRKSKRRKSERRRLTGE